VKRPAAERAFRVALSLRAAWHLAPAKHSKAAYGAFFASCRRSRLMRFLFARISPRFHCSFEEYCLYVASLVFSKRDIPRYYLPIIWQGAALSEVQHLAEPSIFTTRHNGFGFAAKAITDFGFEVATTVAVPENRKSIAARLERSGIADRTMVKTIPADRESLMRLRKELDQGRHVTCFVDRVDSQTGRADIIETGLFNLARITGRRLFVMQFTVNSKGQVVGRLDGPIDCSDTSAALARFGAFHRRSI
jgi:hypothetical protein